MNLKYYFRGWVAFDIFQTIGTAYQLLANSKIIHQVLLNLTVSMSPIFTHLFFLHTIQNLLIKVVLFYDFNNLQLHFFYAFLHFSQITFFIVEIFVFGIFSFSLPSILQLCLSGFTLLITAILYIFRKKEAKNEPRKVIAKHYLESQVFTNKKKQ